MTAARTFWPAIAAIVLLVLSGCGELSNRDDFAGQLKDRTEAEVLKYAGKPSSIDKANPDRVAWIYKGRTFDVQTGRRDAETDVIFAPASDGRLHVAEVVFK